MHITIWDGIIAGAAGGAIAGLSIWGINLLMEKYTEHRDKKRYHRKSSGLS